MTEQATMSNDDAAELLAIMTGGQGVEGAVREGQRPLIDAIVTRGDGDEENAVPMVSKVIQDSGLVTIWEIDTGRPSKTSRNMLPTQLSKLCPYGPRKGLRMFSLQKPAIEPPTALVPCLLSPDDPNRQTYASWGFPSCNKKLISEYEMEQHMKHTHKRQWETIQNVREREEKEIDRNLQRAILRQAGRGIAPDEEDESAGIRGRRKRVVVNTQ